MTDKVTISMGGTENNIKHIGGGGERRHENIVLMTSTFMHLTSGASDT